MKRSRAEMTNIGLTDGKRRLTLVSTNADDMSTHRKRTAVINRIRNSNADIACIQDTHDAITTKKQLIKYIIYQGQAKDNVNDEKAQIHHQTQTPTAKTQNRKRKGGMAIALNGNPDRYVAKVKPRNGRIMEMRCETKYNENTCNPQATRPDMGYAAEIRKEYWGRIKLILYQIKKARRRNMGNRQQWANKQKS